MTEQARASDQDWWVKLAQPRAWLLFLAVYLLLHMAMRLLLSDTLQLDDAEQLIHSQEWRLDYGNFQPPFYTWMLWGLWQIVDPSMGALYVIRYLIIGLTFWLWYRVSCLLFHDPRWIIASASSWLLLGEFAWKLHQGSTHTTLLTLALIMSLHAIVLLLREPRQRYYLYLGLAVGLGMMAKYSYAGFLVPMLIAGLAAPDTRDRLLRWPLLITVGVAALMMSPVLWTLLSPDMPVGDRLQAETSHSDGGLLLGDPSMLVAFLKGTSNFLAPMFLIYLAVFRVTFRRARYSFFSGPSISRNHEAGLSAGSSGKQAAVKALQEAAIPIRALLNRFHLAGLGILLVVALFAGIDHFKVRWLHPFLALVPFWWLLHAADKAPRRRAWEVLKWVTLGLVVLVFVARLWQLLATPYIGKKPSRVTWPVMEALEEVPQSVLQSPQLLVTDPYLAAHIRMFARRTVSTTILADSDQASGVWMWGGLHKDQTDGENRLRAEREINPQWVSAQRGGARYWIGWTTKP